MSDIVITKKSGDDTDDTLQWRHFPSGEGPDGPACPVFQACNPPPNNLYTWEQVYTFGDCDVLTITNFQSLDFELCSPAGDFPIPELRDTCNILVKAEGNRLVIPVSWTVKEESCSIISNACVKTVQEQLCFYLNTFQANSIEDAYVIAVDGISRFGTIRKLTFTKGEATPVTYTGRFEFIAGNVVAGESGVEG